MRTWLILALAVSTTAVADQRIQLPDGRGCWQNDVGFVYGCDPAPVRANAFDEFDSHTQKCRWLTEKEWKSCERMKDMPGQPSNCDHLLPKC